MILEISPEHRSAAAQVDRFVQRFEPCYRQLAFYAALPLVLTPELVHYLRNHFLLEAQVPWVAEVDLLLSDLCNPVGYEQYAIEPRIRSYLLSEMEQEIGWGQMQQVARLLLSYVQQLAQANPEMLQYQELELQQWSAMVYLDDRRESVVQQIGAAYQALIDSGKVDAKKAGKLLLDLDRLTRITQDFAPYLRDYPELLKYADLLRRLLDERESVVPELLTEHFEVLPGVDLVVPSVLMPGDVVKVEDDFWQKADVEVVTIEYSDEPVLERYEFEVATLRMAENLLELQDVFKIANGAMKAHTREELSALEQEIVEGTWQGKGYAEIADKEGLSAGHVSKIGAALFRSLSQELRKTITKKNMVAVFSQLTGKPTKAGLEIVRVPGAAEQFVELLGAGDALSLSQGVELAMVRIPAGAFMMGSPAAELRRSSSESPQRIVTVPEFYLGKYPITQAQWRSVANLPKVERDLQLQPSRFSVDDLPVEQVSWYEAEEFCRRLSALTGRVYRLPSEAEWEYACRGRTTTPFHFGETISTDLANYDGNYVYGNGEKGVYRQKTTPVGNFNAANFLGLHDMHGNVFEWCLDHYHDDYESAPTDGSAWINSDADQNTAVTARGGCWYINPRYCRSAYRHYFNPDVQKDYIGFRVVCEAVRTP
jgi:formylglycine-generating enzyme required for sulfatase activity